MRRHGVMRTLGVLTVTVLLVVLGTGCTKYASEEDLQNLERQKEAALSAEDKVSQLEAEKAELEQLKAQKETELQEVKAEKMTVAERIAAMDSAEAVEKGLDWEKANAVLKGEEMEAPADEMGEAGEVGEDMMMKTDTDTTESVDQMMEESTDETATDSGEGQ